MKEGEREGTRTVRFVRDDVRATEGGRNRLPRFLRLHV